MRNVLRISAFSVAVLSAALLSGCMFDGSERIERQRKAAAERDRQEQMEEAVHRLEASCQGLERALDEARDESALDRQRLAQLAQEIHDLRPVLKPAKPEVHKAETRKPANKPGKKGSDAADLARIQAALHRAGFDPGAVDGKMGAKTLKALESFQQSNGLKPDGKVGPQTLAKLKPFLAEDAAFDSAPEPAPGE